VLQTFVVEGHNVECLDDFGAVGTAERSVGRQAKGRLQCGDTAQEDFFGEVLPLAISVEDGEDEGGELVSARDSTEGDARRLAVTEDAQTEDIRIAYFGRELRAGAGEVACQGSEFVALWAACVLYEERVLVLQISEKALKLIEDILIKLHKRG